MAIDQKFLDEVIAQNKAAGVRWTPGPTSMLELTPEQRRRCRGYVPGPDEPTMEERIRMAKANLPRHARTAEAGLTAVVDWRNQPMGRDFISTPQFQGQCDSCTAFGVTAAMDAMARIAKNIAVNDANGSVLSDLSEAQLYFCNGLGLNCSGGFDAPTALQYAIDTGVAPRSSSPYSDTSRSCSINPGWKDLVTKISGYTTITDVIAMKQQLATSGPLITVFAVYPDLDTYNSTSGVYEWNGAIPEQEASHCVCVVGYDDTQQAWICKNSWGTSWGMAGFFLIEYGQCGIDAQMWSIDGFTQIFLNMETIFNNSNMGIPAGFNCLAADLLGDGRTVLCNLGTNASDGFLQITLFRWTGTTLAPIGSSDTKRSTGSIAWLVGDVNGDGKDEICQIQGESGNRCLRLRWHQHQRVAGAGRARLLGYLPDRRCEQRRQG